MMISPRDRGLRSLLRLPYAEIGPILTVTFPAATTRRDVPHGLTQVPDGYHVLLQSGGVVTAVDVVLWTPTVAWLQASDANTIARVVFFVMEKGAMTYVVP